MAHQDFVYILTNDRHTATSRSSLTTGCRSAACDRADISGGTVTASFNRVAPRQRKQKMRLRDTSPLAVRESPEATELV